MLRACEHARRVAEIFALVSADCGFAHHPRQLGCFAEAFVASAPTLVTRDGDAGGESPVDARGSCFDSSDACCTLDEPRIACAAEADVVREDNGVEDVAVS